MDEVFGAGRSVATVVWQKRTSRDNRAAFSSASDQLLGYAPAGVPAWPKHQRREPKHAGGSSGGLLSGDRDQIVSRAHRGALEAEQQRRNVQDE